MTTQIDPIGNFPSSVEGRQASAFSRGSRSTTDGNKSSDFDY